LWQVAKRSQSDKVWAVTSVIEQIVAARIVPVVAVDGAEEGVALAKALVAGGLPVAEITLRLPRAMEAIKAVIAQCPEVLVGAGTVINEAQVDEVADAGVKFIVSPGTYEPVIKRAQERGIPILPGVATPSDVMRAVGMGLDVVKLFPAGVVGGPAAIKALAGPFPSIRFMPTGGVTTSNLGEYLSIPAVVGVGGTWMVDRKLVTSGQFDEIARLTKEAVATAETLRPAK
jgi:2-dehydro-3-deoxyphosphogluconate aldolase/(4S)-4-hydroxy-2-oxoglutarate aldolase